VTAHRPAWRATRQALQAVADAAARHDRRPLAGRSLSSWSLCSWDSTRSVPTASWPRRTSGTPSPANVAVAERSADLDARLSAQAGIVADLDRRIAQIDSAIETATQRGRTAAAMKLADDQRMARAGLAGQRIRQAKTLAELKVERAGIDGERRMVEADLGRSDTSSQYSAPTARRRCGGSSLSWRCCSTRRRCCRCSPRRRSGGNSAPALRWTRRRGIPRKALHHVIVPVEACWRAFRPAAAAISPPSSQPRSLPTYGHGSHARGRPDLRRDRRVLGSAAQFADRPRRAMDFRTAATPCCRRKSARRSARRSIDCRKHTAACSR